MPENLSFVATAELIYGTGVYEDALDVDMSFAKHAAANEYQVHGHRNYEGVSAEVNEHCFNLDGAVEMGGQLRALELSEDGFVTKIIASSKLLWISKAETEASLENQIFGITKACVLLKLCITRKIVWQIFLL